MLEFLVGVIAICLIVLSFSIFKLTECFNDWFGLISSDLRRISNAVESKVLSMGSSATEARDHATIDAAAEPIVRHRESPVPPLRPIDVAPNLRRPPKPRGGFGSKVDDRT